ncbi:hypothetical protein AWB71_05281 [Caballeronia peredens]|nr:hypothetical protein AWB71_05281 [Caballeronia peredens]
MTTVTLDITSGTWMSSIAAYPSNTIDHKFINDYQIAGNTKVFTLTDGLYSKRDLTDGKFKDSDFAVVSGEVIILKRDEVRAIDHAVGAFLSSLDACERDMPEERYDAFLAKDVGDLLAYIEASDAGAKLRKNKTKSSRTFEELRLLTLKLALHHAKVRTCDKLHRSTAKILQREIEALEA